MAANRIHLFNQVMFCFNDFAFFFLQTQIVHKFLALFGHRSSLQLAILALCTCNETYYFQIQFLAQI